MVVFWSKNPVLEYNSHNTTIFRTTREEIWRTDFVFYGIQKLRRVVSVTEKCSCKLVLPRRWSLGIHSKSAPFVVLVVVPLFFYDESGHWGFFFTHIGYKCEKQGYWNVGLRFPSLSYMSRGDTIKQALIFCGVAALFFMIAFFIGVPTVADTSHSSQSRC